VDPVVVRAACGLPVDARIALVCTWSADATNIRRVGLQLEIDQPISRPTNFAIDTAAAGGVIRLRRAVVLLDAYLSDDPLAAHEAGAILWQERANPSHSTFELVDDARRIDVEVSRVDAVDGLEAAPPWVIDVDVDDLSAPATEAVRLVANRDHRAMASL